jgi:hypothetical protein
MDDALRATIARVQQSTGFVDADAERAVASHEGWNYGERVRIVEDDEREHLYAGEEGYVIISEVGAPEYGNVRISLCILLDDTDCPMPVSPFNIESAE